LVEVNNNANLKPQTAFVGGNKEYVFDIENNANDKKVYDLTIKHLEALAMLSSSGFEFVEVSNVSTQLVAGTIYNFDITFRHPETDVVRQFRIKAIVIPWENVANIIDAQEVPAVQKPAAGHYGGHTPYTFNTENPMDKLILEAVENGLKGMMGERVTSHKFKEVRNGKSQLVAGVIYSFDIVFADADGNDEIVYEAVVYVVPWENKLEIQSLTFKP